jgi:hypothetical protein
MSTELSSPPPGELEAEAGWVRDRIIRIREHPERLAWIVLLSSFTVFLILLIAIPWAMRYSLQYAQRPETAAIEPTQGTLLLYPPGAVEPIAITELRRDVPEGSTIVAGEGPTQATIRLLSGRTPEQARGSVQLYSGTRLVVEQMRSPLFEMSGEPYQVRLRLEEGQMRVFTESGEERPLQADIVTPHGNIELATGSYQVAVTPAQTDITVSAGEAQLVQRAGEQLSVTPGLRAWMTADATADAAVSASQNLLRNGNFTEPMRDTWESYVIAQNVTPGKVTIMERDGRRVAYFARQGEDNVPTEVGIRQVIGKDVNVYDKLELQVDVKLLFQSLPGAGYLSSEYPLRVEITYTDIYGKEGLTWGHGFYYRDPDNPNWQIVGGEKISPFNWYTYRSPNLMEVLKDTRPARIDSIRIYSSGWNYQSMVSEVFLTAE